MVIIGAKGLAKELLTVLKWNRQAEGVFLFDNVKSSPMDRLYGEFPIIKSWELLEEHFASGSKQFALGVGSARDRRVLSEKVITLGGEPCSIISKHALISELGVKLGCGVTVLSQATITADVEVGDWTLINKSAIISHDSHIGSYCVVSPGAKVLGRCRVGNQCEIGANAVILPGVSVGAGCRVGAGAVVTKDLPDNVTVAGVPARPLGEG